MIGITDMRLYGTITSERASKGQGGEYLAVTITDKDKSPILYFVVREGGITGLAGRPFFIESLREQAIKLLEEGGIIEM